MHPRLSITVTPPALFAISMIVDFAGLGQIAELLSASDH
jgi:hypothetical protein